MYEKNKNITVIIINPMNMIKIYTKDIKSIVDRIFSIKESIKSLYFFKIFI